MHTLTLLIRPDATRHNPARVPFPSALDLEQSKTRCLARAHVDCSQRIWLAPFLNQTLLLRGRCNLEKEGSHSREEWTDRQAQGGHLSPREITM